jgi:hypothetical protein
MGPYQAEPGQLCCPFLRGGLCNPVLFHRCISKQRIPPFPVILVHCIIFIYLTLHNYCNIDMHSGHPLMGYPMGPVGGGPGPMPGLLSSLGAPFVGNINVSLASTPSLMLVYLGPPVTWSPPFGCPSVPDAMGTSGLSGPLPLTSALVSEIMFNIFFLIWNN